MAEVVLRATDVVKEYRPGKGTDCARRAGSISRP